MNLKKMTATFGKLKNETLELHDGLNVISLPNESGKSTWAEFLLAMLYGVDTSERQKAGGPIPVKERYRPWDGTAMTGTIEFTHEGKNIAIERTSTARALMGQFKAYDTDSGLPATDFDAKNCGTVLIGAERSVYERSGFLRQRGVGLSKDASLEQRLSGLVSTGDEDYSYTAVEAELRKIAARCKHNNTGLLPAAERDLAKVNETLDDISAQQAGLLDLQQRERDLIRRRDRLQSQIRAAEAAEARQRKAQFDAQQQAYDDTVRRREALENTCAALPEKRELTRLSETLAQLNDRTQTAVLEATLARPDPPQAPDFPVFAGLTPEDAAQKAAADSARAAALQTPVAAEKLPKLLPCLAAGLAAVCAVLAFVLPLLWLLIPAVLLLACIPVWLIVNGQRKKQADAQTAKNAAEASAILAPYGAETPQAAAARFAGLTADYDAKKELLRRRNAETEGKLAALEQEKSALLETLRHFSPGCDSLAAGSNVLREALNARADLEDARREELNAHSTLELLRTMAAEVEEDDTSAEPAEVIDLPLTRTQLSHVNETLVTTRSELHRAQGQLDMMGNRIILEAEKEQLSARVKDLTEKNAALALAAETLAAANREVQSRFSPLLCGRAAELFGRLTGGKYDKLLLDQELNALCRENGAVVSHPAQALSCGTADQAYLAVRLAICELLLPDAPLILDDALVAFDDERCKLAMQVLREIAQTRQVLLFTCQSREAEM